MREMTTLFTRLSLPRVTELEYNTHPATVTGERLRNTPSERLRNTQSCVDPDKERPSPGTIEAPQKAAVQPLKNRHHQFPVPEKTKQKHSHLDFRGGQKLRHGEHSLAGGSVLPRECVGDVRIQQFGPLSTERKVSEGEGLLVLGKLQMVLSIGS